MTFTRHELALLLALTSLALAAALAMSWFVFERLPHLEDEVAYLFQARVLARGALWVPQPENDLAFWTPFVLSVGGRRFGKYPPGWPAVLAIGESAGAGWAVNPVLGAMAVPLLYLFGREVFDRPTAFLACLLMVTSPMFVVLSGTLMPHALTLVLALLALLAYRRTENALKTEARPGAWPAVGGAALGWIAITRPLTAACVAVPLLGLTAWRVAGHMRKGHPRQATRVLAGFAPMGLATLLVGMLYPAYVRALTGDPTTNLYTLWWPYDRIGFGPGIGPHEGHTPRQAIITARGDLRLWAGDLFGWPGISWAFVLPGVVARRRSVWGWVLLAVFPIFVGVHLAYWIGSQIYGTRYYYEALPALALLTAGGMRWLAGFAGRWQKAALLGVLGTLLAVNLGLYMPKRVEALQGLYSVTRAPLAELAERQTGDALIVARADRWWEYGALLAQMSPWLDGSVVVVRDLTPEMTGAVMEAYADRQVLYFYEGQFHDEKPY